jgi:hypothetical protein
VRESAQLIFVLSVGRSSGGERLRGGSEQRGERRGLFLSVCVLTFTFLLCPCLLIPLLARGFFYFIFS